MAWPIANSPGKKTRNQHRLQRASKPSQDLGSREIPRKTHKTVIAHVKGDSDPELSPISAEKGSSKDVAWLVKALRSKVGLGKGAFNDVVWLVPPWWSKLELGKGASNGTELWSGKGASNDSVCPI